MQMWEKKIVYAVLLCAAMSNLWLSLCHLCRRRVKTPCGFIGHQALGCESSHLCTLDWYIGFFSVPKDKQYCPKIWLKMTKGAEANSRATAWLCQHSTISTIRQQQLGNYFNRIAVIMICIMQLHYDPLMMQQKEARRKHAWVLPVCFLEK